MTETEIYTRHVKTYKDNVLDEHTYENKAIFANFIDYADCCVSKWRGYSKATTGYLIE